MICTWGGVIILVFSGKRYSHQIEMFSVIKSGKGRQAASCCAGIIILRMCISLTCVGKYCNFALIFLILFWSHLLGIGVRCFPCAAVVFELFLGLLVI